MNNAAQPHIRIDDVTKSFGAFSALRSVTLDVPRGSFTTLLGPSGCGKTTLLRLLAGFDEPDSGSIRIDGAEMNGVPAFRRKTPLVFQDYALFPHMTVQENIAYGLKLQKARKAETAARVGEMMDLFGLQGLEKRLPKQLSGGQQQRVAFARALVTGRDILLMDEPLSNLDAKMRVEVRRELRELQRRAGITAVFVTHDQDEALSLSDYVAVFEKGRIRQAGTPWEVYYEPANAFVADFVGTANLLAGIVEDVRDGVLLVRCRDVLLRASSAGRTFRPGDRATLMIRPECLRIGADEGDAEPENRWMGAISGSSFLGRQVRYEVQCGETTLIVDDADPSVTGVLDGTVRLSCAADKIHVLSDEADSERKEGETHERIRPLSERRLG